MKVLLSAVIGLLLVAASGIEGLAEDARRIQEINDPSARAEALVRYFEETEPTGESFALDDMARIHSKSARLLLLDSFATIDPISRNEVGDAMRRMLEISRDPAERVVILRNLARVAPDSLDFIARELRKLLQEQFAQLDASTRDAVFDGIVHLRDASFAPILAELAQNREFEVPAALTLDRLGEAAPLAVMRKLNASPGLLSDRPLFRADLYGKANCTNLEQRRAFEDYLERPDVGEDEKSKALAGLIQRGHVLTVGLFTGAAVPASANQSLAQTKKLLAEWTKDPRFENLRGILKALQAELRDAQ